MSLTASDSGGNFKSVEAGTYVARCIRLIDLGTQHSEYEGKEQIKKQILIMWELPSELIEGGEYDGKPYTISHFYTNSLNEKARLRKDLESWRGKPFTEAELKGFSLLNILGHPCMISTTVNESGKAKLAGVSKVMKGLTCPDQINPLIAFDLDDFCKGEEVAEGIFSELSDGIKKIIKDSDEYKDSVNGFMGRTDDEAPPHSDDDIPF